MRSGVAAGRRQDSGVHRGFAHEFSQMIR
jgi:hypothetical protein